MRALYNLFNNKLVAHKSSARMKSWKTDISCVT